MYSLGIDVGSSSIKVALVQLEQNGKSTAVKFPDSEMIIHSPSPGFAEQNPEDWWSYTIEGIKKVISKAKIDPSSVKSIGISYQMHGLVALDAVGNPVMPSIIWCDSRAVEAGNELGERLSSNTITQCLLNHPGNFTASKLYWVKKNKPSIFSSIHKIMLPGDYIAYKMSGEYSSTYTGMSEGMLWDYNRNEVSKEMIQALEIDTAIIPPLYHSFEVASKTNRDFNSLTGVDPGTPISYRAGDQPNNAYALGVLESGEVAGTGGTSGVIYAVSDTARHDEKSRVNTFAHVNYHKDKKMFGTLMCINGTGILYNWIRANMFGDKSYNDCEAIASEVKSDGVVVLPFGNGAERILSNALINSHIAGIDFNRHDKRHILRAALEGIAFAFVYGLEILQEQGIDTSRMKVGNDNLFQSKIFSQTLSNLGKLTIEVVETTGAIGAAWGSAVGAGLIADHSTMKASLHIIDTYYPSDASEYEKYQYGIWKECLVASR